MYIYNVYSILIVLFSCMIFEFAAFEKNVGDTAQKTVILKGISHKLIEDNSLVLGGPKHGGSGAHTHIHFLRYKM